MKTKKQIKAAAAEATEWDERRAWELAWRKSVKGQKFKVETVMLPKITVTGKPTTILQVKGFNFQKK